MGSGLVPTLPSFKTAMDHARWDGFVGTQTWTAQGGGEHAL